MKKYLAVTVLAAIAAAVTTAAEAQTIPPAPAPAPAEPRDRAPAVREGANGLQWKPAAVRADPGDGLQRQLAIEGRAAVGMDATVRNGPRLRF